MRILAIEDKRGRRHDIGDRVRAQVPLEGKIGNPRAVQEGIVTGFAVTNAVHAPFLLEVQFQHGAGATPFTAWVGPDEVSQVRRRVWRAAP